MDSLSSTLSNSSVVVATLLAILGSLANPAVATAADTGGIVDAEVRACVDRALPKQTLRQDMTLQVVDATETMRESSGTLHWKRFPNGLAKVMFVVDDSPQYRGVGVLMNERSAGEPEVYMYSPELRRDRRISSAALAGPLLGTDFSYEDFALLQHLAVTGDARRLADAEVDGQPAYVMETTPNEEQSSYSRVTTFVDKLWCLPVLTQFYGHNGSLYKELRIDRDEVRQQGSQWIPLRSTMHNHKQNSRTMLDVSHVEIDVDIADELFTPGKLRQGH